MTNCDAATTDYHDNFPFYLHTSARPLPHEPTQPAPVSMAPETPVDERVDLSDLDMLDDEHRHGYCLECTTVEGLGQPFVALCGRRAVYLAPGNPYLPPPDACEECVRIAIALGGTCRNGHRA